ncbi:MAG: glycoside hydrolase family 140 protein [Chitinophagaceae bacterium]|nr:glycoside hydrolase family 140 protein [Chitinophagaceae bacterium]
MKRSSLFLVCLLLYLATNAQLTLSVNQRFILRDHQPFFYLADTGWELFHRLNREEADDYLKTRAAQGFTVIQAVILAELDGLHTPNAYGELPLRNDDPTQPNEAYFKHVDYIIDKAKDYNLVIGLLPSWGDKIFKNTWGTGPEIFNAGNAGIYGEWLAKRYKNKTNIIWIVGGDRNPRNEQDIAIWNTMANGIVTGCGSAEKPLITFHPQPNPYGSAEWFMEEDWLSFNMFQNGHCRNTPVYDKIQSVYQMTPVKPVIDGEPLYEDHPVCFNVKDLGKSNAYDVRLYGYLDVFSGAFGHTYGCHDVWQFYAPGREAINGAGMYWRDALYLPGAQQMQHLKNLILSRPFTDRIPDQSLILENNQAPSERIQATRGKDYAFVYTAAGKSFTIKGGILTGNTLNAHWFNPRNGNCGSAIEYANKGTLRFVPPSTGYGQDWVLILDDASKQYAMPTGEDK